MNDHQRLTPRKFLPWIVKEMLKTGGGGGGGGSDGDGEHGLMPLIFVDKHFTDF
jgi:hypothetical protein